MGQLSGIKISTPTFNEVVPSTKQKVKLTPFRVGDEKVLLMASQSKDTKQMLGALKTVIENCVSGVDADKLASFDLEYLFLKLRAVSVGESADVGIKCEQCDEVAKVKVDLSKVKVIETEGHTKTVELSKDLVLEMRYPDVEVLIDLNSSDVEKFFDVVCSCIDRVYHGENVYEITPVDYDDVKNILNSLTSKQFEAVKNFFVSLPKMQQGIKFKCKACEHENNRVLEGLASFF